MNGEDEDDAKQDSVILDIGETEMIQLDAICRVCANNNGRIIGIFSEEGATHDLAVKMNMYLPIKIAEADTLPLQCCWNCASTVLAWHEFVIGSVEADRRLRELQIIASKAIVESVKDEHLKSHSTPRFEKNTAEQSEEEWNQSLYIIQNSDYTDAQRNEHNTHSDETDEIEVDKDGTSPNTDLRNRRRKIDIKYKIFCDICKKGYTRRSDMARHRKLKHSNGADSETDAVHPKVNSRCCRYCKEKFETITQLKMHVNIKHGVARFRRKHNEITAEYFCDVCGKGFTRNHDMNKHRRLKHPSMGIVEKVRKDEKVSHLKKLKMVGPDNRSYYKCDVCRKVFKYAYNMLRHQTTHTKVYGFVCHICAKKFPSSGGLKRHLTEHHFGVKKFSCEICGKSFAANATKVEHMNIHTNNRPFVCDICGKAFKQKASLRSHKLFHTNDFKFACNFCQKRFRRAYELKTHTWTHTGHRPHQCSLCSRTFRMGQDLKRHLRVHDKLGECTCDECGATFSQQKYLNNHKRSHKTQSKSGKSAKLVNVNVSEQEEAQILSLLTTS